MAVVFLYPRSHEREPLRRVFRRSKAAVWLWLDSESGRIEDELGTRSGRCGDLMNARLDLLLVHNTIWPRTGGVHECLPSSDKRGPTVLYSSDYPVEDTDAGNDVFWINRGLTIDPQTDEASLSSDEAGSLLNWATSDNFRDLPAILRPRPKREALLLLKTACEGFLASWAAGHSGEVDKFRESLTRMGWFDLMNAIGQPRLAQGEGVNALVDLGQLASRFDDVSKAGWWVDLLGPIDERPTTSGASLRTRVLADLQAHKRDKVGILMETLAGPKDGKVQGDQVAAAYLEIASALETPA